MGYHFFHAYLGAYFAFAGIYLFWDWQYLFFRTSTQNAPYSSGYGRLDSPCFDRQWSRRQRRPAPRRLREMRMRKCLQAGRLYPSCVLSFEWAV